MWYEEMFWCQVKPQPCAAGSNPILQKRERLSEIPFNFTFNLLRELFKDTISTPIDRNQRRQPPTDTQTLSWQ